MAVEIAILAEKGGGIFYAVKMAPFFYNEKGVGPEWAYKEKMTQLIAGLDFHYQELAVG